MFSGVFAAKKFLRYNKDRKKKNSQSNSKEPFCFVGLVKPRIEKSYPLFIWVEHASIIVRAAGLVLVTRYPWFTQIYEERTSTR